MGAAGHSGFWFASTLHCMRQPNSKFIENTNMYSMHTVNLIPFQMIPTTLASCRWQSLRVWLQNVLGERQCASPRSLRISLSLLSPRATDLRHDQGAPSIIPLDGFQSRFPSHLLPAYRTPADQTCKQMHVLCLCLRAQPCS
jgi:hypothetical protein